MPVLTTLWAGMLTSVLDDSGTDSSIVLMINERGGRPDLLHHTFPDTAQNDQETGQANVYEITEQDIKKFEGVLFSADQLNQSSIRVGIRGDDLWRPDAFFVWGEQDDGAIMPLALTLDLARPIFGHVLNGIRISTDASEGPISFAVERVRLGLDFETIHRLILLVVTADKKDAGTDDKIELTIVTSAGRLVVNHIFLDTPQDDLERAQANLYFVPLDNKTDQPFRKDELDDKSITLRITGEDMWSPARLFLFGLTDDGPHPEAVVPLVHLPVWPFKALSQDTDEGDPSVTLPLFRGPSNPVVL